MNRLNVDNKIRQQIMHLQGTQILSMIFLIFILSALSGCNSGGEASNTTIESPQDPPPAKWEKTVIQQVAAGGIVSPYIKSSADNNSNLHMSYFTGLTSPLNRVNYILWDVDESTTVASKESVVEIDNNNGLALTLDNNNFPVIAYQGGVVRDCGQEKESDAMFSIKEGGSWSEYTGGIGYVERNPVFTDGLAGADISTVVDSNGDIHICYQFRYEGCDAMNFNYPDLLYVKKNRSSLSTDSTEEIVEGNEYNTNGTANVQNNVGGKCSIILDSDENPVIFYYAELTNTEGLRVARRQQNGEWEKEWVDQNIVVGDLSVARVNEGGFAAAYYVTQTTDGTDQNNFLKYAIEQDSTWQVETVDDSTQCGNYCSLAFNSSGEAAIAYYDIKSHNGWLDLKNLKFAQFDGSSWTRETIASTGDIGLFNYLWFDENDKTVISTYSNSDETIYLYSME